MIKGSKSKIYQRLRFFYRKEILCGTLRPAVIKKILCVPLRPCDKKLAEAD